MLARSVLRTIAIALPLAAPIGAQTTPAPTTLSAAAAQAILEGCRSHSTAKRQSHAIVVMDGGAGIVAALRMDGNRDGIMAFATAKARAVAKWGFSTAGMADGARETPGFGNAPDVVTVPGGVPVYNASGALIGSVGVSGEAPADDVACAEAGIKAAGLQFTRPR